MNFAEQLKNQLNIVDVVSQYVRLKRQGSGLRYVGLCPFHSEKTPSFNVNGTLQIYKCFGCQAGGDVFKFVQEIESLTFPETLKLLAERYGIPMPERHSSGDPEAQRWAALLEMHDIAAEIFQKNLRGSAGNEARSYLESRGVSRAAMDEFRLGLSDGSGQQLAERLQKFGPELMEASGLVIARTEGGGFYDRFRARLMFPIHSESGKVIAFGGRALRAGDEPKYLNSPDTKLYKKSTVLYNLHRAKIDARKHDRMILVEGYMDVIGVYSAGIHEVVAASGTALRIEQVRAIKRQVAQQQASAGRVILNFDADSAGTRSTEKYIGTLLTEGLRVNIVEIPGGLDPDEYIQQNGAEAYNELLNRAPSYFHWLAQRAKEKYDMRTAEGSADAFKFIAPVLQQVSDAIERAAIGNELAEYLGINREVIHQTLRRGSRSEASAKPRDVLAPIPANEKLLLGCFLASREARELILEHLRGDLLSSLMLNPLFGAALRLQDQGSPFSVDSLANGLEPRMQQILTEIAFSDLVVREEDAAQQAVSCLEALEEKGKNAARDALRRRIRELENEGNLEEAFRLADELNRMVRTSPGM